VLPPGPLCARLRPDTAGPGTPLQAAKLALRAVARRIGSPDAGIAALDSQSAPLVPHLAPRTTALLGVSTSTPLGC
jgi:hypothetical protein